MNERSPGWVLIQNLQHLLVGPTCSGLDERQNTTSAVWVGFFLSHGERGARMDSGWGRWGCTAQSPPLRAANSEKKGRKGQNRKEGKKRGEGEK